LISYEELRNDACSPCIDPDITSARVQTWNVTVERQIGSAWQGSVSYLGSYMDHLWNQVAISRRPSDDGPGRAWHTRVAAMVCALLMTTAPAFAQIDLTGTWVSRMHEDWFERGPGRDLADYTGLPLSDEGRTIALKYEPTLLAMRERQCLPYSPYAWSYQPTGFVMWSETDRDGRVVAWKSGGNVLRGTMTIWMDGRSRPSENAFSEFAGFTTGRWEGDTLSTYTTNLKAHTLRRGNGTPASDRTTITAHFTRHDDLLTVTTIVEDPIYLTEPHVVSRTWVQDPRGDIPRWTICNAVTEIPRLEESPVVPHHLPGQNSDADFITRTYNIPAEAAYGHAETLYPEYRKKLADIYVLPKPCGRYCCGWLGFEGFPASAPGLSCVIGGTGTLSIPPTTNERRRATPEP
jgi:hypothetical protein